MSRVRRRPINEIASTRLFAPLSLTRTRLRGRPVRLPKVADPPGTIGDGGLWTSAADLVTWLQACNHAAFGLDVQRVCERTGELADGTRMDYASGIRITPTPYRRLITHGGTWEPWPAKTARIPERQVTVAVLSVGGTEQAISDTGTNLARALAIP